MRGNEVSPGSRRHAARRRWIAAACLAGVAVLAFAVAYSLRPGPSAEEQLRALDAAHAVPDEDNAAGYYMDIVLGNTGPSLDSQLLPWTAQKTTLARAWRSADFPEVARWIEDRRGTMEALLQASRKPRCWFPVSQALQQRSSRFSVAYSGAHLLLQAVNNDLGEGRVEPALEKLLGVLRMGAHFRAQFDPADYAVGLAITAEGVKRVGELLRADAIPPDWLARFEAALPPVEDTWREDSRRDEEINRLYRRQTREGVGMRLLGTLVDRFGARLAAMQQMYLGQLTEFRAVRILLELRRYRNETGVWPAGLDDLHGRVPPPALLDPVTRKPFDYRLTGNTFQLQTPDSRRSITGP
jgi:hypothetical protein